MSSFPVPDFASLGKSLKDFIDYWRNFKGKRVRIIGPSSSTIVGERNQTKFHVFKEVIEGTVESVQAYPPGIFLKEVEQFVRHEYWIPFYVIDKREPADWYYNTNDSTKREQFERKFVSFNFVFSVEFL